MTDPIGARKDPSVPIGLPRSAGAGAEPSQDRHARIAVDSGFPPPAPPTPARGRVSRRRSRTALRRHRSGPPRPDWRPRIRTAPGDARDGCLDAGTLPALLRRLDEAIKQRQGCGLTSADLRLLGYRDTSLPRGDRRSAFTSHARRSRPRRDDLRQARRRAPILRQSSSRTDRKPATATTPDPDLD
jgi:hypothetical protein